MPIRRVNERLEKDIKHPQLRAKMHKVIRGEYLKIKNEVLRIIKDAIRQEVRNALSYLNYERYRLDMEYCVYIPIEFTHYRFTVGQGPCRARP